MWIYFPLGLRLQREVKKKINKRCLKTPEVKTDTETDVFVAVSWSTDVSIL